MNFDFEFSWVDTVQACVVVIAEHQGGVKREYEGGEEEEGTQAGGLSLKRRRGEGPQVDLRILVPSKVSVDLYILIAYSVESVKIKLWVMVAVF